MQFLSHKTIISLIIIHLFSLITQHAIQAKKIPLLQDFNATTNSTTFSPWLRRFSDNGGGRDPGGGGRFMGCRRRPWICDQFPDFPRVRRYCCRNRCVDLNSDPFNCGLCGIRCRFRRQCCRGICVNTLRNPFNCGRCGNVCRSPSYCFYGMCGYAEGSPPYPFPFPPRRPRPPCPPRPPRGRPAPPRAE